MAPPASRKRPLRYKLVPVLTLLIAGLWAWAGWQQARAVEKVNSARILGMVFSGSALRELDQEAGELENESAGDHERPSRTAPEPPAPTRSPLFPGLQLEPEIPSPEERRAIRKLEEQIVFTEGVIYVWKRGMFGVAALVGGLGLIGIATRYVRRPHLFASAVMLAAMVTTLIGMQLLESPEGGGLEPLSIWSHIIVGVSMSAYPVILIVLLARKPKPESTAAPSEQS